MKSDSAKEEAIFDAAIQIADTAARAAYLDAACGADTTLRLTVAELLRFHDTPDDLLAKPVVALEKPPATDAAEQPGAVLGRYRIQERIGEGGFGAVYRAEQLEPVRRDVALKIIKPGMGSHEIIARFDAERQALALMQHPNIATVLDAGTTPSGRPYFVMELVAGRPIDEYSDSANLSIVDRLQLFLAVCRAVQHAHQKGIVHRDLKPANVLVVAGDTACGIPKVIDFGIAKLVNRDEANSVTRDLRSYLGTPEYMSPEQISDGADIDTRADIYALGGVLYRLLTGFAPLDLDMISPGGLEAIWNAIRTEEPVRPSRRFLRRIRHKGAAAIGSESDGEWIAEVAARRGMTPGALGRMFRGDLDWIVLKALEKDRSRRYATASELAADIERYLRQEPVLARPPSTAYRLARFARRNRIAVTAATLVCLAIVVGGAAATFGFVRAESQRRHADEQRQLAEMRHREAESQRAAAETASEQAAIESQKAFQVATLLEQLLGAADPDHGRPANYTVRQLLDDFSQSMFDALADQPDVEAALRRTVGRAYWRLSDMSRAGPHLERALELRRSIHGPDHALTVASRVDYGRYLVTISRFDEAMAAAAKALESIESDTPREEHAWALFIYFRVHDVYGRHREAEICIQDAVRVAERVHGERHPTTLWLRGAVVYAAIEQGNAERAESMARELIQLQTEVLGSEHGNVAYAKVLLGMALSEQGKLSEAESILSEAMELQRRQFGGDSSFVARAAVPLANVLRDQRRYAEAELVAREAVAVAERATMDREFLRVRAYRTLATIVRMNDPDEAARLWKLAIETQRRVAPDSPFMADMLNRHAVWLRANERFDEAAELYREALGIVRARSTGKLKPTEVLHDLANTLRQQGKPADGELLFREAAALSGDHLEHPLLWLDWIETVLMLNRPDTAEELARRLDQFARVTPNNMTRSAAQLGRSIIYLHAKNPDAAEPLIRNAADAIRPARVRRAWGRAETLRAECLILRGQFEEAEQILQHLDRAARVSVPFEIDDVLFVTKRLVQLYDAWDKPDSAEYWRSRPPTP